MKPTIIFLVLSIAILFSQNALVQKSPLKSLTTSTKVIDSSETKNNSKKPVPDTGSKERTSTDEKNNTSDWIAGISVGLALIALIISVITATKTYNLANKDFLLTHRPFVWVENFGYLNNQNIIINPINQVMIMLLNSPAKFHKEHFEYYIIDNLNNKTVIETQEYLGEIRYPSEKSQYTNSSSQVTTQIAQALTINQELERIIKIEYSWLSSEKQYFFEAKWRLDKVSQTWKVITQTAD
jgi:hypothetical protein